MGFESNEFLPDNSGEKPADKTRDPNILDIRWENGEKKRVEIRFEAKAGKRLRVYGESTEGETVDLQNVMTTIVINKAYKRCILAPGSYYYLYYDEDSSADENPVSISVLPDGTVTEP